MLNKFTISVHLCTFLNIKRMVLEFCKDATIEQTESDIVANTKI